MKILIFNLLPLLWLLLGKCTEGSHFRGAIIMVRPATDPSRPNLMEISYQISWRRGSGEGGSCNENTISHGTLIGSGSLQCIKGCGGSVTTITTMLYQCTDFSASEDWSFGERRLEYNFPDVSDYITIQFSGGNWIAPFNSNWQIPTTFSLQRRNDTRRINSTPRAKTAPVVRLQQGCNHTISLAINDPDNDVVHCRWAVGSECGGICNRFPGAELDAESCSFHYSAIHGTGYKAAAIMLEDFLPHSETALSSVALQFLIDVFPSDSLCSSKPHSVPPTIPHGSCVAVPRESSLSTQIIMASGGEGVSITEIQTVSPPGMAKGTLETDSSTMEYYVNITWTPSEDQQDQIHQFCYTASNSVGLSSDQACMEFMVGSDPPAIELSTNNPNEQTVHPTTTTWNVRFDKDIQKATIPASIRFKEFDTDKEVYQIDTSSSSEIDFLSEHEIEFKANFTFQEKTTFYISFDRGIVIGLGGCGPGNEPIEDKTFWTFTTLDVTPPILWFLSAPVRTGENATLTWTSNENITQECLLISSETDTQVNCGQSQWSSSTLPEGTWQLIIDARDDASNPSRLTHTFYVDLTPPMTNIIQGPKEFINMLSTTISFTCNEPEGCSYECIFYDVSMSDMETFLCHAGTFTTPQMEPDSEYMFGVRATDSVGNLGYFNKITWFIDVQAPRLSEVSNTDADCTADLTPHLTGYPKADDNRDTIPVVSYHDQRYACHITRTWTAQDKAGNSASHVQNITLNFRPTINALSVVSFTCDSASDVLKIPSNTGSAFNPCNRPLEIRYSDSVSEKSCPVSFMREWTVVDTCSHLTQTLTQRVVVNDVCPQHACGRNFTLPHGVCSFGECFCIKPWYGDTCTDFILEPVLKKMNGATIQEGQDYTAEPRLLQGTEPVTWHIEVGLEHMSMDIRTGVIKWLHAVAGEHEIKIKVENQVGQSMTNWILVVKATYQARLNPDVVVTQGGFQLSGKVEYEPYSIIKDHLMGIVPVSIDVMSAGTSRTILVYTRSDSTFSTKFSTAASEYGIFSAQAHHPTVFTQEQQVEWHILGMAVHPSNVNLKGESTGSFRNTFDEVGIIINDGPGVLKDLKGEASLGNLASHIRARIYLNGIESLPQLETGENCSISISIETTGPLSATFSIKISPKSGVSNYITVSVNIENILPVFTISPPELNTKMARAETKLFLFNITNVGRIEATSVSVNIPENDFASLVGFGSNALIGNNQVLQRGESITLEILVQIPSDQTLGDIKGKMTVYSKETAKSIPFQLLVSSNVMMDLTIRVEDEYTYFAEGKPLVDNAQVRLDNYLRNLHMSGSTSENSGTVTFRNIPEDRYELYISADNHQSDKRIIVTDINQLEITVFLERSGVKYHFSVTPVKIEDTYQIQLEADFETRVPMPVVTVYPREVDLTDIEEGYLDTIQFNVTNHGLIRAENVSFEAPTGHPFLKFTSSIDKIGTLEAQSSVIIPVKVERSLRQKRYWMWVAYGFKFIYSYLCGSWQFRSALGILKRWEWRPEIDFVINWPDFVRPDFVRPVINWPDGDGCCRGQLNFTGYTSSTIDFCHPCIQAVVSCFPTPDIPVLDCLPVIAGGKPSGTINTVLSVTSLLNCIPRTSLKGKLKTCIPGLINGCIIQTINSGRRKRSLKGNVNELVQAMYPAIISENLAVEIFGSDLWINVGDRKWYSTVFSPILDDSSDAGPLVSQGELDRIRNSKPPVGATLNDTVRMLSRFNNTLSAWQNGHLEPEDGEDMASFSKYEEMINQINTYNEIAKEKGFSSFIDAYSYAASQINQAETWEEEEGVCAVVRIRIEQEAALTREGFLAKLDIENGEVLELIEIYVELIIRDGYTGEVATDRFAIGNASLSGGLTSVDGSGVLQTNADGTAEWLIIPYSSAAPGMDKPYNVGGILKYSVDGESISITLLPSTITVKPDASLRIHYFWDNYVISDDPFTPQKEQAVPFSLGIVVKNTGYGTAYDMRITSAQPDIISNEKGLLVTFNIIASNVGLDQVSPSLTVNLGDITPNATKVARWWLISSLQGEFKNYSATFENINPLGDPKLSLLDELKIHQLIRNVHLYGTEEDDGILDFLTNEQKDIHGYPDMLYSSNDLTPYTVSVGIVMKVMEKYTADGVMLVVSASGNVSGITYFRSADLKHSLTTPTLLQHKFHLASTRIQDATLLPLENTWLTISQRKDKSVHLHILDMLPQEGVFDYEIMLCTKNCPQRNDSLRVGIPLSNMDDLYAIKDNFSIPEEKTTTYFEFTTQPSTEIKTTPFKESGSKDILVVDACLMLALCCLYILI